LEQPHTSAGRIPSEKGFRHYVDCMMEKETLQGVELMTLQKILQENISEINDLIARIGQFISCITNYASFILIPSVKFNNFKYLQARYFSCIFSSLSLRIGKISRYCNYCLGYLLTQIGFGILFYLL
jgi:hypothetical protein